jgi:hypothetical protein
MEIPTESRALFLGRVLAEAIKSFDKSCVIWSQIRASAGGSGTVIAGSERTANCPQGSIWRCDFWCMTWKRWTWPRGGRGEPTGGPRLRSGSWLRERPCQTSGIWWQHLGRSEAELWEFGEH